MNRGRPPGTFKHGISIYEYRKVEAAKQRAVRLAAELEKETRKYRISPFLNELPYKLLLETQRSTGLSQVEVIEQALNDFCTKKLKETQEFRDFLNLRQSNVKNE